MSDLANNQEINQEIGELEIDVGTEHKNNGGHVNGVNKYRKQTAKATL